MEARSRFSTCGAPCLSSIVGCERRQYMNGDIVVSGIMISAALYGLAFSFFWPEKMKLSLKISLRSFRLLLVAIIVIAFSLALIPVLFRRV